MEEPRIAEYFVQYVLKNHPDPTRDGPIDKMIMSKEFLIHRLAVIKQNKLNESDYHIDDSSKQTSKGEHTAPAHGSTCDGNNQ